MVTFQPSTEELAALLGQNKLFSLLDESHLRELAGKVSTRFLQGGEILFHQGDPGDRLFLVASGRLRVLDERGAIHRAIAEIGQGETVGEMSLLTHETVMYLL